MKEQTICAKVSPKLLAKADRLFGNYTFMIYANDTSGNNNFTKSVNFSVDTTFPPTFSSFQASPLNGTAYSPGRYYEFNVTISGNIDTVWVEFDGTNYTQDVYSRGYGVYSFNKTDLSTGNYEYKWWANNTAGIINSSTTRRYNVDVSGCDCGSTNASNPCIGRAITTIVWAKTPNEGTAVNASFTWEFNSGGTPTYCGKFANGDYWVAPKDGSTVEITNITSNGIVSADADPIMESMGLLDGSNNYGNYNSSENIIPHLPINYTGINSLVAAVQRNETLEGICGTSSIVGECVDAYNVLTVLTSIPENGGNETIRPNIAGKTKELLTFSDFNFSRIPSIPYFTGTDAQGYEDIRQRWSHSTEIFGIQYGTGVDVYSEGGRAFRSHILIDEYGGGVASRWYTDMMILFSDDNQFDEKRQALAAMISYGLDIYHSMYDAPEGVTRYWGSAATQSPGKFMPAVFMASLMKDSTYAENLRQVGPNVHNVANAGPLELAQVHKGVNGYVWGDVARSSGDYIEGSYWQGVLVSQCFDGATGICTTTYGTKSDRDPYGYIDGPANKPGSAYMGLTAGGQRGMVATMHLMPQICEIINYDPLIEYIQRLDNIGRMTYPDPCVTPDTRENTSICDAFRNEDCEYYKVTWGPDPSNPGDCICV